METKRNFLYVPLLLAAIFAVGSIFFSSCGGVQDMVPYSSVLRLYVENEDGENLLDPATPGNLVGILEANLNYEGKTYLLSWVELTDPFLSENCHFSKAPGGVFYGIWYEIHPYRGVVDRNHLEVGTFYEPDFKHKRLTLSFPKYGLKYDMELSSRNPKLKVNGKEAEPWQYTIVLPAEK